ncbi:MAG TPA: tetratricopeptide repeat protein [Longimicrobiales bacterium]|nr:tetratricopeptide repeat protein [Longimicrobiales bacterium]
MSERPSFLDELKRRKVVRVALVYGATVFAVLQAADIIVPRLQLPDWTITLLLVIALLGFPIALVLAWAFDLTPEGVRADTMSVAGSVDDGSGPGAVPGRGPSQRRAEPRTAWVGRRTLLAAGVMIALGLALGAGWFAGSSMAGGREGDVAGAAADDGRPSIAVLPFDNISREADTEPFVEGLHDDVLTQLSRIERLRVISRTSVQEYRDTERPIPEIASELGVGHVLEGGVQRDGGRVRLNVQLIDGRTDEHVWAQTFDRDLTIGGVFEIQSELAAGIAGALANALSPEQMNALATSRGTDDLAAWEEFQRGMAFFRRSLVSDDVDRATAAFRAATRLDPRYLDAWARLAIAEATMSWEFGRRERLPRAEEAAERAREIDPDHYLTHLADGYVRYYGHRDYDGALRALGRAERLRPGDPEVLQPIGWVLRRQGRWQEAIAAFEQAELRDPRHFELVFTSLGVTKLLYGDAEEGRRHLDLAAEIDPRYGGTYAWRALDVLKRTGDVGAAAAEIRRAPDERVVAMALGFLAVVGRSLAPQFRDELLGLLRDPPAAGLETFGLVEALASSDLEPDDDARKRALAAALDSIAQPGAVWNYQGLFVAASALARIRAGAGEAPLAELDRAVAEVEDLGDAYILGVVRYNQAAAHALAGDVDGALRILADVVTSDARYSPLILSVDPIWDPIRDDPGFRALASRGSPS